MVASVQPALVPTLLVVSDRTELTTLQTWFESAESAKSWAGDDFYFPCSDSLFLQQLCRKTAQNYSLIQQDSAELLGFGQICDRFGCHHLARIIIAPSARGRGLAKILLSQLISQALETEFRPISLYVHKHNVIALKCYQQMGFVIAAPREPENPRLHFMTLTLEQAISIKSRCLDNQAGHRAP